MKNYYLKVLAIIAAGVAVYIVGARAIDDYLDRKAWNAQIVASYPMANQHIEWTWAGKGGWDQ